MEQPLTVEFRRVEPPITPIDFEGCHLILRGNLSAWWRMYAAVGWEDEARRVLYPWLCVEKKKHLEQVEEFRKKNGISSPENAVPAQEG